MKYTITATVGTATVKIVAESTDAAQASGFKNSCLRMLYDNAASNTITELKVVEAP